MVSTAGAAARHVNATHTHSVTAIRGSDSNVQETVWFGEHLCIVVAAWNGSDRDWEEPLRSTLWCLQYLATLVGVLFVS